MWADQLEIAVFDAAEAGQRSGMDRIDVIGLGKGVVRDFPIAIEVRVIREAIIQIVERKAGEVGGIVAQVFGQAVFRLGRHVDEHEAFPGIEVHRGQAVVVLRETVIEALLAGHLLERAVRVIDPAVEPAGDDRRLRAAESFLARFADDGVAAMRAGIVEGADLAVLGAHPVRPHHPARLVQNLGSFFSVEAWLIVT